MKWVALRSWAATFPEHLQVSDTSIIALAVWMGDASMRIMLLTPEQRNVLDGGKGHYLAKCMRWLVQWGEVMGAKRLIACENTHALLPVPNLMARNATKETMENYMADLREACAHRR